MARVWTCQRTTAGVPCKHVNPKRKHLCEKCGKRRPATKRPAHMAALDLPYEHYVEINGGDFCGICGLPPSPVRRLDRDHDHKTGRPRGLLCHAHNRMLRYGMTPEVLRAAADYLERAERNDAGGTLAA